MASGELAELVARLGGAKKNVRSAVTKNIDVECIFPHVSGTGSEPHLRESGWQRSKRFSASHDPRTAPNRSTASYA
jgi:hypothetical protein